MRLEKSIQQLQEWHAVPGDIVHVPYDPTVLSVAVMEQQDWMVPWFTCSQSQSAMHCQIVDLQQRILPCSEEERIVIRQTEEAVACHSQQLETLKAAIEAREAGSVATDSDSFLQEDASVGMDISTAEPHTVQQYSEGQLHVLRQRLLTSLSNLLADLRAPDSSSSLERTAEAVQDDTLSTFQESADDDMDNDEFR